MRKRITRRLAGICWAVAVLLLLSCGPGGQMATPAGVPTAMPTAAEPQPTPSATVRAPRPTAARPTQAAQATIPAAATDTPRPSPLPTLLPTVTPSPHAGQPITPATAGQVVLLDRLGTGALQDMAWLPDGRTAVAAYVSGLGLYDGRTLEEQRFIAAYGSKAGLIASPDGRHVALIAEGGVQLWDTSSGQLVRTLEAPTGGARMIAFGAAGKTLAISGPEAEGGSPSEAVTIWELAGVLDGSAPAARLLYRLEGYANGPSGLTFSPDGKVLVTARWYDRSRTGVGGYLEQWDASTGRPLPLQGDLSTAPDGLQHLVYSPDGRLLAGSAYSTLFIWDAASGELLKSLENESFPNALAFSGDGGTLAAGSSDKAARVWDVAAGELRATISGHTEWVTGVAFSPPDASGAALLATATAQDGIQLWDIATGERRAARQPVGHSDSVEAVAYSPDGEMLATAGPDQTVWLWDAGSGRALRMLDADGMSTSEWCACIWSLAFSPDGRTVATGSTDARVRVWDVQTGELLETSAAMGDLIYGLDYSSDGQRLAAGDTDGLLWVWDTAAPLEVGAALSLDAGGVIVSLSFQPAPPGAEGHVLATGSGFGAIRVWDADTGSLLREMQGSHNSARAVYSPDGSLLAAGESGWADEFPVRLWDPESGELRATLTGHTKDVSGLAFSADGRVLASGDWDGFTRLWDVATAQPLGVLEQGASVKSAAFRPDGRQLATAGFDGLVWIWGLP